MRATRTSFASHCCTVAQSRATAARAEVDTATYLTNASLTRSKEAAEAFSDERERHADRGAEQRALRCAARVLLQLGLRERVGFASEKLQLVDDARRCGVQRLNRFHLIPPSFPRVWGTRTIIGNASAQRRPCSPVKVCSGDRTVAETASLIIPRIFREAAFAGAKGLYEVVPGCHSRDKSCPSPSPENRIRLNAYNRLSGAGPAHCEVGQVREAVH